ncbi:MAG: N-acetylmuramoyl-L-alanine amidase [Candidatus Omnitrophica bacterium]|nr:N-acetylmuramoyl-L-alanine amidase [Candidatus Omnitrophota bacterium]
MTLRTLFILLFVFWLGGCATVSRPPVSPAGLEIPLSSLCKKYNMDCQWDGVLQTVVMSYRGTKIQAMVGSSTVLVGNNKVLLNVPLTRRKGNIMVGADFERLVIGPPLPVPAGPVGFRRFGKIVIDAGHGGKDPGAFGFSGQKEKEITLDIARRVKKALEFAGISAIMTRDSDQFISLQERTAIASQPGVDFFVSIHANSNKTSHAHGVEVYYMGPFNAEDKADPQRKLNEKKLCGLLKMRDDSQNVKNIVSNMLYCYKLNASSRLADQVSTGLAHEMGERSRGSKPQRYFVLRNTLVPAVLVEVGFLSNPKEEKQLKDPQFRQRIADTITKSILEFLYASGA